VHVTAATARTLSVILLLTGLLGTAALALVAHLFAPTSEGEGIHRRHAPRLVVVQPMLTPAGRPVADVTEFTTLARLAERNGLLVLHWTRSGVETFVVQDEGAAYRYRPSAQAPLGPTGPSDADDAQIRSEAP